MAEACSACDAAVLSVAHHLPLWRRAVTALGNLALAGLLLSAMMLLLAGPQWHTRLPEAGQQWLAEVWPEPDWQQLPKGALLADVQRRGTLVVAVREYPRPAPPSAPTPPEPDGFDAGMARFIAERLGVKLKLVGLKPTASGEAYAPPAEPVDLTVAGDSRVGLESAMAVPTRYSDALLQLMVLRGSPIHTADDLRGRSVCLQRGSSHAQTLQTAFAAVPRDHPSSVRAVYAFMGGECDALAEDAALVQRLATQEEWRFYRAIRLPSPGEDIRPEIVLSKADAASTAYLDAVVRYWQIGGAQLQARAQRAGNVSFELLQLQGGMVCHS